MQSCSSANHRVVNVTIILMPAFPPISCNNKYKAELHKKCCKIVSKASHKMLVKLTPRKA